jgi:hypothetical protein
VMHPDLDDDEISTRTGISPRQHVWSVGESCDGIVAQRGRSLTASWGRQNRAPCLIHRLN